MPTNYYQIIASELNISAIQVENTINLLTEGATVPFISRYRKELTDSLDEVYITHIRDRFEQLKELDKRRKAILQSIDEQGKLTPELKDKIEKAQTLSALEDIYLPYRPKKKTRATVAKAKGLEPLAKILLSQKRINILEEAEKFIDEEKEILTAEDALQGARDIIAEWVNENDKARGQIRKLFHREATIRSKVIKKKAEEATKYSDYFDFEELLKKSPSHRVLAILRGENEGLLRVSISINDMQAFEILKRNYIKTNNEASEQVEMAIEDSYKRLMHPSMETEFRNFAKEKADEEAIKVFADNLRQLLLASPLGQKNVLAIDPGFRTGCKIVCLDKQGKLLHNETIYPHPPVNKVKEAVKKVTTLVDAYKIEAIAIGNGTAGRETEKFIRSLRFPKDIIAMMVNESGASVYSASKIAREEFPHYDVTVRGAVSIGRRLMDPLAELVKIDPKSIGVGQYQHDVNQQLLQKSLDDVVISSVNAVGVEVNTASAQLLHYVSGLGRSLAKKIVEYRDEKGPFKSREAIKKVPRFGEKAFEQAAGFLRVKNAKNPLDYSAVHPESYPVVDTMTKDLNCTVEDLIHKDSLRESIDPKKYVTEKFGLPTLQDIMTELAKPGRDPREKFDVFEFDKNVHSINDLKEGMVLPGIITNITKFGAFVDVGVHQDGLVHISQIANKFIKDPNDEVKLNQKVKVKVLEVDIARKRISFSMKDV